jgi:hypothetical protein
MRFRGDPILLISGALLGTTVALYFAGVTEYPYGWIALSFAVVWRLGLFSRKNRGRHGNFRL